MNQAILFFAGILLLTSQIWLVALGFKRGGLVWAVLIAFFSLIAGLVFCIAKKAGWLPWTLNLAAWFAVVGIYRNWF